MKFVTPPDESWTANLADVPPAVWVLAGLVVAVVIWRLLRRASGARARSMPGRPCRWKRDQDRKEGTLTRWRCTRCGVEAYSARRGPPVDCKRPFRPGSL